MDAATKNNYTLVFVTGAASCILIFLAYFTLRSYHPEKNIPISEISSERLNESSLAGNGDGHQTRVNNENEVIANLLIWSINARIDIESEFIDVSVSPKDDGSVTSWIIEWRNGSNFIIRGTCTPADVIHVEITVSCARSHIESKTVRLDYNNSEMNIVFFDRGNSVDNIISVLVTANDSTPIEGASVSINYSSAVAKTDEDGVARFSASDIIDNGEPFNLAGLSFLAVAPDGRCGYRSFTIEEPASIGNSHIKITVDHPAILQIKIRMQDGDIHNDSSVKIHFGGWVFESRGSLCTFENLPIGKLDIFISAPKAVPMERKLQLSSGLNQIEVSLDRGVSAQAILLDEMGNPIVNAQVEFELSSLPHSTLTDRVKGLTDSSGAFELPSEHDLLSWGFPDDQLIRILVETESFDRSFYILVRTGKPAKIIQIPNGNSQLYVSPPENFEEFEVGIVSAGEVGLTMPLDLWVTSGNEFIELPPGVYDIWWRTEGGVGGPRRVVLAPEESKVVEVENRLAASISWRTLNGSATDVKPVWMPDAWVEPLKRYLHKAAWELWDKILSPYWIKETNADLGSLVGLQFGPGTLWVGPATWEIDDHDPITAFAAAERTGKILRFHRNLEVGETWHAGDFDAKHLWPQNR